MLRKFHTIKEFIENKIITGAEVTLRSLRELKGFGKVKDGPKLEEYMNRYIEEVKNKIQNNQKI